MWTETPKGTFMGDRAAKVCYYPFSQELYWLLLLRLPQPGTVIPALRAKNPDPPTNQVCWLFTLQIHWVVAWQQEIKMHSFKIFVVVVNTFRGGAQALPPRTAKAGVLCHGIHVAAGRCGGLGPSPRPALPAAALSPARVPRGVGTRRALPPPTPSLVALHLLGDRD